MLDDIFDELVAIVLVVVFLALVWVWPSGEPSLPVVTYDMQGAPIPVYDEKNRYGGGREWRGP